MVSKAGGPQGVSSTGSSHPLRTLFIALAIFTLAQPVFAIGIPAGSGAVETAHAAAAPTTQYSLGAQALLGHGRTDLYLTPTSQTLPRPSVLDKVQVKTF